ncbi:hypothetical protein KMP13_17790 [Epibacterium ulvae]|uniref:ATP-binding protein n=1 Tax=Epibacterium ulvae TaxID=1156985 RepID=UPI001BFCACBA|nr:ATP-binding protein [Epibacterium ulvae]MBT8155681.1 hypothetical protein [Epibacterium ulvae]
MGYADGEGDWSASSSASRSAVRRGAILGQQDDKKPGLRAKVSDFLPDRLSLRLVLASLLISSFLSLFATAIQIFSSYQRQKTDTLRVFQQVEQVMQRQLEQALWEFDFEQVELILDGLMAQSEILHVVLVSPTGHQWMRGDPKPGPMTGMFELSVADSNGEMAHVGDLVVHLTLDAVKDRVKAQFWTTLISNIAKAYVGATLLMIVVHRLIVRHLMKVAVHVSSAGPIEPGRRLRLDRAPPREPDALDQIVGAVHGFEARVEGHVQQLDQEMSDRAQAQREAEQAALARTQFLANMSQDIHTPMNSILGLFQLIQSSDAVPDRHREQAQFGLGAAHRLSTQLINMLDLSRLDSGDITPAPIATDLRSLADGWLARTRALVQRQESKVEVSLDWDPDLSANYSLDGTQVTRIVECLCDNAAKFCPSGRISIALRPAVDTASGGLEILVRDCGPGIRYEDRDRIFERFTRIEDHLARKTDGTGLGLALAREMAQLLGGSLEVMDCDSTPFTNGFRLILPNVTSVS